MPLLRLLSLFFCLPGGFGPLRWTNSPPQVFMSHPLDRSHQPHVESSSSSKRCWEWPGHQGCSDQWRLGLHRHPPSCTATPPWTAQGCIIYTVYSAQGCIFCTGVYVYSAQGCIFCTHSPLHHPLNWRLPEHSHFFFTLCFFWVIFILIVIIIVDRIKWQALLAWVGDIPKAFRETVPHSQGPGQGPLGPAQPHSLGPAQTQPDNDDRDGHGHNHDVADCLPRDNHHQLKKQCSLQQGTKKSSHTITEKNDSVSRIGNSAWS